MRYVILWMCAGALGLGLLLALAARRDMRVSPWWYVFAIPLGPIFLAFVLPLLFSGRRR